jgi:hypothetical protein
LPIPQDIFFEVPGNRSFRLLLLPGGSCPVPVGLAVGERRYPAIALDAGDPDLFDTIDTP